MNILDTWQFYTAAYVVSVVVFFQFYKLAVKDAKRDGAATILLQLVGSATALVLIPLFPLAIPSSLYTWALLIVASVFYATNDRLQTTARKHLEVSVFSILNQLKTVLLILFGIIIFSEPLVPMRLAGAGLILAGNVLLFYKHGKVHINTYVWVGIAAAVGFVIALSIDIGISNQFNLPLYVLLTLFIPAVLLMIGERISIQDIRANISSKNKKYYAIAGIAWAIAITTALRAFQLQDVTIIVPIQASAVLLNILVAYIFLNERSDKWKKLLAGVLVLVGVYLTTLT